MSPDDRLVPADKFDLAAARRATEADVRALEPVIDELVGWCLDCNWPVSHVLGPFLAGVGGSVVPAVRAVLDDWDATAKWHVIVCIVGDMPPETLRGLQASLERIATSPTPDEVAEELPERAAELLAGL